MDSFSFPLDLEREILETAAQRYPGMIPALLRICHRVHKWIEPLLYRVVDLSNNGQLLAAEAKAPILLQNAVRHVFGRNGRNDNPMDRYTQLLSKCSGVINLSVDLKFDDLDLLRAVRNMRLQKLALDLPGVISTWALAGFNDPLFQSVTHLDLYVPYSTKGQFDWRQWCGLVSLPRLTHLAVSASIATEIVPNVLPDPSRLVLVIIMSHSPILTFTDPRVVLMTMGYSYQADWTLGARGGDNFWVRAMAFVNRKRAGEIASSCYVLDEKQSAETV
ncbi:hypothetical protein K438DRAFT_1751210 [Mycena galopus ATCC 62051]|nr:hypothetical protein K438DRAFT_1751210 [Mycena galopus ATCC 62051]